MTMEGHNLNNFSKEVSINGMIVRTTRTAPIEESQTFYVSSQTNPDTHYVVRTRQLKARLFDNTGRFVKDINLHEYEHVCMCPDFTFHRWAQREDCKHIEAVKVLSGLAGDPYTLALKLIAQV